MIFAVLAAGPAYGVSWTSGAAVFALGNIVRALAATGLSFALLLSNSKR